MATITITLAGICAAQNHARLTVAAGSKERSVDISIDELVAGQLSLDDIESFAHVVLAVWKQGKTKAQMKSGLQAGIEVTF